ncbi:Urocanate hydratase [Armadillidium nasatum]|uniref:Urocanate hydratase n=1 Tax=Armadillidium nasatum TaxID=96803 RepID=A0A5N5T623_9CRUS|nr:Urocanate hydratase [Armadillidium nasatum]
MAMHSCWRPSEQELMLGGDGGSDSTKFRYPSYVQDIMGIFSLGFGPFRWVCTSGDPRDLETSDIIADKVMQKIIQGGITSASRRQYEDNQRWIREAGKHRLVVGSQARILYSDQLGRMSIARAFNDAVRSGQIRGPIVISRDHHDVSGTDSPFRETSNIYDGSAFTADMAVQNCIGDAPEGNVGCTTQWGGVGWVK